MIRRLDIALALGLLLLVAGLMAVGAQGPTPPFYNCATLAPGFSPPIYVGCQTATLTTMPRAASLTPTASLTPFPPPVLTAVPAITQVDNRLATYTLTPPTSELFQQATAQPVRYVVQAAVLNVRNAPSTKGLVVDQYTAGKEVLVYGTLEAEGYTWASLAGGQWAAIKGGSAVFMTVKT